MEIEANGIRFHYRFDGPADAPVLTLSHSLAADLRMWEPQVPIFSERFRVLSYDVRGHGKTAVPPAPYDIKTLSDDVAALCGALGIAKTHFCGLSLGGMTGQRLAADHPDLIDRLVLCDTSAGTAPEMAPAYAQRAEAARAGGMAATAPGTLERWFTAPFRDANPDVVARIGAMIGACPVEGYAGCCFAIAGHDETGNHARIKAPTLVLVGADDPSTTVAHAEAIHAGIAGSELVVLADAAHLSNVEQPEAFGAAVMGFLTA